MALIHVLKGQLPQSRKHIFSLDLASFGKVMRRRISASTPLHCHFLVDRFNLLFGQKNVRKKMKNAVSLYSF